MTSSAQNRTAGAKISDQQTLPVSLALLMKKESNAFKSITEMDRNLEGQGLWDCDPKSGMLMLWLGFPLLSMLPAPAFEKSAQPAQQSKSFW